MEVGVGSLRAMDREAPPKGGGDQPKRKRTGSVWNIGNSCYAGASWSLLSRIPELVRFHGSTSAVVEALREVADGGRVDGAKVRRVLGPSPVPLPREAAGALEPHAFHTGRQEDAQEHLLRVIQHLEKHGAPTHLLSGKVEWVTTCPRCKHESVKPERFSESVVRMDGEDDGPIGITDHFAEFQRPEHLSGDNAWLCPKCQRKVRATRQPYIVETPEHWLFFLKRFRPQSAWKLKRKTTAPDAFKIGDDRWRLKAIVHHHGDTIHLGHYTTTVVEDRGDEAEPGYIEVDDHKTRQARSIRGDCSTPYILLYSKDPGASPASQPSS